MKNSTDQIRWKCKPLINILWVCVCVCNAVRTTGVRERQSEKTGIDQIIISQMRHFYLHFLFLFPSFTPLSCQYIWVHELCFIFIDGFMEMTLFDISLAITGNMHRYNNSKRDINTIFSILSLVRYFFCYRKKCQPNIDSILINQFFDVAFTYNILFLPDIKKQTQKSRTNRFINKEKNYILSNWNKMATLFLC